MFCGPDGKFDSDNIFEGNIIMLNDSEGHQFYANVGEITDDKVVLDLNHPHAGKDLYLKEPSWKCATPPTKKWKASSS